MTQIPDHAVRDHAVLGGSSAERWTNCPGSVFFLKTLPAEVPSEAALNGTQAHEVAEIFLKNFLDFRVTGELSPINVDGMDAMMVEHAKGYVETLWKKVFNESVTDKAYGQEELFVIDQKLQMYGYVDTWCVYIDDRGKRVGVVCDYKYGYHFVSPDKNAQLAFYAVALREEIKRGGKDLDYVRAIIYQPRAGGDVYRETKFSAKQLDAWKKKFFKAARTIFEEKKATLKVGSWCRWCRAQAICTKYQKELSEKSSLALIEPDVAVLASPEMLPDETLKKIILNSGRIEDFLTACKQYAKARFLDGNSIPGLKCVNGPTRRQWLKDEDRISQALQLDGVSKVFNQKLRGITEIEKELVKIHGKAKAKEVMANYTEASTASVILVPETDERPAITNNVNVLDKETDNDTKIL